jgi:uncharacterized protein (DUF885 family)
MTTRLLPEDTSLADASRIVDDAWDELRGRPFVQRQLGIVPTRLPDVSFAEAQRRSAVGSSLIKRLDAVDLSRLPHDLALSLRSVRFRAKSWAREADWYWTVSDALGIGFFGLFLPAAYGGGLFLNNVNSQLAAFTFTESTDADRYMGLVSDYARLIDQFTDRTTGQAERGLRMPKVQVLQARSLLMQFKQGLRDVMLAAPRQIGAVGGAGYLAKLENCIVTHVAPAFDRALQNLSDDYLGRAPDEIGCSQYKDGAEIYAELVKLHTTLDLDPEQVHSMGIERLARIQRQKSAIQTKLGFEGNDAAFVAHLEQDARWLANTPERVSATFQRYIDRITPRLGEFFSVLPKAPYSVAPLPQALQGSMTFGYFDPPRRDHAEGRYWFNPSNLTTHALFTLGSLTYHELMPGHHLQIALQYENTDLHPFRQYGLVTAYNEGWAEYAATLAGEIGMYEEAEERYGRLVKDGFLTSRLVVDTGMNALGWSLERARQYMRENSGMSEAEIRTESVRYSCDVPGQALAYKIGDWKMMQLRERMQQAMGPRFDLKLFHDAVLGPGAIPLPELEWHVDHEIERLKTG